MSSSKETYRDRGFLMAFTPVRHTRSRWAVPWRLTRMTSSSFWVCNQLVFSTLEFTSEVDLRVRGLASFPTLPIYPGLRPAATSNRLGYHQYYFLFNWVDCHRVRTPLLQSSHVCCLGGAAGSNAGIHMGGAVGGGGALAGRRANATVNLGGSLAPLKPFAGGATGAQQGVTKKTDWASKYVINPKQSRFWAKAGLLTIHRP